MYTLTTFQKKTYRTWLILPAIVLYTAFFIVPNFMGIGYALTDWNAYRQGVRFIGFENFRTIFAGDPRYLRYITNTLLFTVVSVVLKIALGLGLAVLLDRNIRARSFFRVVFFLPVVLPPLVIGIVFKAFLHPSGLVNQILELLQLGFLANAWLVNKGTALIAIVLVEVWRMTGYVMVIFLAGLQLIPRSYYEAAEIDGAGGWARFRHITLPLISYSMLINVVLQLIGGLKVFSVVMVMTGGGPAFRTGVINLAVFELYSSGLYGMSTAFGVLLFVVVMIAAFGVLRLLDREVEL